MCAFVKPSTITTSPVGSAYTYKSTLPSPPQNYIDQQFPNAIDGLNGGTYSPSALTFTSSSNITDLGVMTFNGGDAVLQVTGGAAFSISGSGSFMQVGSGVGVTLLSGSTLTIDGALSGTTTGGVLDITGSVNLLSGSTLTIDTGACST